MAKKSDINRMIDNLAVGVLEDLQSSTLSRNFTEQEKDQVLKGVAEYLNDMIVNRHEEK